MDIQTRLRISQEITARIVPHNLRFLRPAQTSRNTMLHHQIHYLVISGPKGIGVGEYAPIIGLSLESELDITFIFNSWSTSDNKSDWAYWRQVSSAFVFAIETAYLHYEYGIQKTFAPIPINGLVWMNNLQTMQKEALQKINDGFNCIKFKIGAISFDDECRLLADIRNQFDSPSLTIRLDANGAFGPDEVMSKLNALAQFDIHSIEQPIRAGSWSEMAEICQHSPIPIALDEELIGVHRMDSKQELIDSIKPHYIVLKPTLHGGLEGCDEWVECAEKSKVQWWATSALESNIGLHAIAQWLQSKLYSGHQGLGTGALYSNNIPSPLKVQSGFLSCSEDQFWDIKLLQ